jgi:hypothetical protein
VFQSTEEKDFFENFAAKISGVLESIMKDFLARIGTFSFLIGIGLIMLFIASDASTKFADERANYSLLCGAVTLFMVGFLFRKTASPPEAADRFRSIRKIQEQRETAKKEKAKAQGQKK